MSINVLIILIDNIYKYEYNNSCFDKCPSGTYPLIDNNYICYDSPEGYYLDLNESKYKKCFESCKYCYGEGNNKTHKCEICKSNYIFINDYNISETNCYNKCENYYYLDENSDYKCTNNSYCPDNYPKLIKEI